MSKVLTFIDILLSNRIIPFSSVFFSQNWFWYFPFFPNGNVITFCLLLFNYNHISLHVSLERISNFTVFPTKNTWYLCTYIILWHLAYFYSFLHICLAHHCYLYFTVLYFFFVPLKMDILFYYSTYVVHFYIWICIYNDCITINDFYYFS